MAASGERSEFRPRLTWESYLDIFVVAVLVPLAALAVVVGLGTAFGSF